MTIPFSQVRGEAIKLKVSPSFSIDLVSGAGIRVDQLAPNKRQISVDFSNLERDDIASPAGLYVGTWDTNEEIFKLVKADTLKGAKGDAGNQGDPGPASPSDYATRALAAAATISGAILYIRTFEFATGSGGGASYKRGSTAPGSFTSNGGTVTWVLNEPVLNVKMFGAIGDGSADDTSAMNLAHSSGQLIHYPAGDYKFSLLTLSAGGIVGDGPGQTRLNTTDTGSNNAITFNGSGGAGAIPIFRDFLIQPFTTKSSGAGIYVNPSPSNAALKYSQFDNIIFVMPIGLRLDRAQMFKVRDCQFINYAIYGAWVTNTYNPDEGDSSISGCIFNESIGTGTGVYYESAGGLRIINNKFLGGVYHVHLVWSNNTTTGDLIVANNSMEVALLGSIAIERSAGTGTYGAIHIVGNQIGGTPYGVYIDGNGLITQLIVSGNIIASVSACGIQVDSGTKVLITGNNLIGPGPLGIKTGGAVDTAKVGGNLVTGFTNAQILGGTNISTSF